MSSNLFAISFFVSNFALFLFSVQTAKRKCDLEKPHKYRIYNKNTIGVQPLGVQIPMVFSPPKRRKIEYKKKTCGARMLTAGLEGVDTLDPPLVFN